MHYVCIDGVSDEALEFIGYQKVAEGTEFSLYLHNYTGEEHVVANDGKRYLMVEDVNDATALSRGAIIKLPRI